MPNTVLILVDCLLLTANAIILASASVSKELLPAVFPTCEPQSLEARTALLRLRRFVQMATAFCHHIHQFSSILVLKFQDMIHTPVFELSR